ncbi:DUF3857 domain-containing protein [Luteimonas arsenica]|uniref:DUF3857 domain-containing protein n=1 Tax=Luteimonas arsenica TaxID=1586242 RepID=UPI0010569F74|nr:DUF3857 domain-containing protein [Luteimonas arsenica]
MLRHPGVVVACLFALAIVLFPASGQGAERHRVAPDPDWIEMLPVRGGEGSAQVADGARFLLVDDQVNLLGAEPVWHRRLVEQVVQERALASAARLSIDFQPLYQRVELHAVELLRAGERLERIGRADVQVLRREAEMESGLLDGRLTVQITVPDVRVGDRVEYRFSVIGANPIFGSEYHDVYRAAYSVPLAERRVRFVYPPGVELRHLADRPGYRVLEGGGQGHRSLEVRASDLPRVTEDDDTPQWHDSFGRLQFSTLADWPAVARWAEPLYPARLTDRAQAVELARRLGLDAADPRGSLERAIAFVQGEVRYTAIDMGSNSHAPSAPETTLERRFGDCKDKSALLVSLLAEAGIEAEPVLVNTVARAAVLERLPSPLAFDHVVVRARLADGEVWIDPTRDRERAPLAAREPLPFRFGLPVFSGGGLVEVPAPPPVQPAIEVTQRIRLETMGDRAQALFGVVTDYRRGNAEGTRAQYEDHEPSDIGDRYLSYMRGFYDGIAAAGLPGAVDAPEPGAMRVVESYRLDWDTGREGRDFGIVLFQLADWLPRLKRDDRNMPLLLGGPDHATHAIRVDYPRGWSISPEDDRVENPWFTFERRVSVEGGDLVVRGSWRRHADEVPAADYARFREDVATARDLLVFDVNLGAGVPLLAARPADWAWPLAAFVLACVLLVLAWWRRLADPLSGMVFAPRHAMARLLDSRRAWWGATALVLATSVLIGGMEEGAAFATGDDGSYLRLVGGIASTLVWFPLFTLLTKGCFRMLSVRAGFQPLLLAAAWACVPYLLFMLLACLALGGRFEIFTEGHELQPGEIVALLSALLFIAVGMWWYLVATVNANAVAAGTTRARALGALMLSSLFLVVLVVAFALVAAAVQRPG